MSSTRGLYFSLKALRTVSAPSVRVNPVVSRCLHGSREHQRRGSHSRHFHSSTVMANAMPRSTFYVPTIDVAPYIQDPKSPAAQKVVDEVRSACISSGFFQIVGHGISKDLQRRIFKAAADFFALPYEEKIKLDAKNQVGHRGYDVLASQSYEEGVMPDLKEGYYVGADIPTSNPLHGRFFSGPNVWPSSSLISISTFKDPCEQYFKEVQNLTLKVLTLIGETVATKQPNGETVIPAVFNELGFGQIPACPLRLLHYPSATRSGGSTDKPQYGASAHTDFGAITLLLQDDNPGLEVLDTGTPTANGEGIWRPIDPNPDAYVVNIGDMVSRITGDAYKSSVHRVVCKRPERDRYSIVFFLDGCLDAELKPLANNPALEGIFKAEKPTLTVEQHMFERFNMSYGKGQKDARKEGEKTSA